MVKHELKEKGYEMTQKRMNLTLLRLLWAIFTIASTASTFFLGWFLFMRYGDIESLSVEFADLNVVIYFVIMIAAFAVYFIITRLLMTLFSKNKSTCISIRVKDTITFLPTAYCREALKPWQFIVSYIVPLFIIYTSLFMWWFVSFEVASAFVIFLVMLYISPDMVLVLYILYVMAIKRPDYISIEEHIIINAYKKDKLWKTVNKQ